MDDRLKQIAAQCNVVVHLASQIAKLHADQAKMFFEAWPAAEDLADVIGPQTARLMEELGEILNGMDAASDEDEWTAPIFAEAHRLFPATSAKAA